MASHILDRDPLSALIAALRGQLLQRGIDHIRPQPGVLDDDGVFDVPIDLALTPHALLPIFVEAGKMVYAEAWFDRQHGEFPFCCTPNPEAMLGVQVEVVARAGSIEVGIVCISDALVGFVDRSPTSGPILSLS